MAEGTTTGNGFDKWLHSLGLSSFIVQIKAHGLTSKDDFKYIQTEKQFQELLSALNGINFLQKCKLESAWKQIVPNPTVPPAQIHFLGDEERAILDRLNETFANVSKDIALAQKSCNTFNESTVSAKKNVHSFVEKMMAMIDAKKEELLKQIDLEKEVNQSNCDERLDALYRINESVKKKKDLFLQIASDANISSKQRSQKLQQLLIDLKQSVCIAPIKSELNVVLDEESFRNCLSKSFGIFCVDFTNSVSNFEIPRFRHSRLFSGIGTREPKKHYSPVRLKVCDDQSGKIEDAFETRYLEKGYTLKQLVSAIEKNIEADEKDESNESNKAPGVHVWLKFGVIRNIYSINKAKAKVTEEELDDEDQNRWVEVPHDYLKTTIEGIQPDIGPALIVIERRKSDGSWPRAKGDDWRKTLQTGDIIDACDDQGKWYESLVRFVYPKDHSKAGKCIVHFIGWNIKWDCVHNIKTLRKRNSMTRGPRIPKKKVKKRAKEHSFT